MSALDHLAAALHEARRFGKALVTPGATPNNTTTRPIISAIIGADMGAEYPAEGRGRLASALATGTGGLVGGLGGNVLGNAIGGNRPIAAILGSALGSVGGALGARALIAKRDQANDDDQSPDESEKPNDDETDPEEGGAMIAKEATDVSDFRLAFPAAAGHEADFVEGFLKRAHEICGHSIEGTPDLPQALLSIAIAEKLAGTPAFLDGFIRRLSVAELPGNRSA